MGSASSLALALNVSAAAVGQWKSGDRQVPPERCTEIEALTGFRVSCEELRPDVGWVRMPDPSWGHPNGRPLVDPSSRPADTTEPAKQGA